MHGPSPPTHTVILPSGVAIVVFSKPDLAERHPTEHRIDLERPFPHHPHRRDDRDDDQDPDREQTFSIFCP